MEDIKETHNPVLDLYREVAYNLVHVQKAWKEGHREMAAALAALGQQQATALLNSFTGEGLNREQSDKVRRLLSDCESVFRGMADGDEGTQASADSRLPDVAMNMLALVKVWEKTGN
jgi:hypothetical protein